MNTNFALPIVRINENEVIINVPDKVIEPFDTVIVVEIEYK